VTVVRTAQKGVYLGEIMLIANGQRTSIVTLEGKVVPSTITVMVIPSSVSTITVDASNLKSANQLLDGSVLNDYILNVAFADKYGSKTDPNSENQFTILL